MPLRVSATTLLSILQPWSEVEEPIHRRLAQLADAEAGREALWIGCGSGRSVLWWSERFQTHTEGVDPDPKAIETAERAARQADLQSLATFQVADPTNLPHEDQVFDTTIVHMLHLPGTVGEQVIKEAGRVTRPMGTVMALVPSWLQTPVDDEIRVIEVVGLNPRLPVEWKGIFREASVVELSVEEAAPDGAWLAHGPLALAVRGWRAAGWTGIRTVQGNEVQALRRMVRARVLGLSIIKGARWQGDAPAS